MIHSRLLRKFLCIPGFSKVELHAKCSSTVNSPFLCNQKNSKAPCHSFGQPTYLTHPHIVGKGEILRGITIEEVKSRRSRLLHNIQEYSTNMDSKLRSHVVVIPSSTKKFMSDKIPYVFRQNSDFLYLSGCLEPDSVLVLVIDQKENTKSILFVRPKDEHAELWDGPRTGVTNAVELFGLDEAYSMDQLCTVLKSYVSPDFHQVTIWYDAKNSDLQKVTEAVQISVTPLNICAQNPTSFIHKLRVIKSEAEVELMRKTCRIASQSINETMQETRPGDSEHHIFARVDYKCRMRDASYLAYPPVVASGKNGTTIHYINNSQIVNDSDLVLIDAGCEFGAYTSDITRTWPANGNFTDAQRTLYEVLLTLQKDMLGTLLKSGGKTLDELFDTMCLRLGKYLQEINLVSKSASDLDLMRAGYSFCPHHISHYLGMDVHDTPLISRKSTLIPGMVFTVEPGIYISSERKDIPPEFRGLGLRIEDDICICADNKIENLSENCIKEIDHLENLLRK